MSSMLLRGRLKQEVRKQSAALNVTAEGLTSFKREEKNPCHENAAHLLENDSLDVLK